MNNIYADMWKRHLLLASSLLLVTFAVYHETLMSLVSTWTRSETYAHGYLIAPISIYLAWIKRKQLADICPELDIKPALAMLLLGPLWLLSNMVDVIIIQQYVFVISIIIIFASTLGRQITYALVFPLGYLLLAVPVGEMLISPLIDFTAVFTAKAIQLTGIPMYWEDRYITLPTGKWSVVEACSGIRYLIASFTLGLLYAYLMYRSMKRRLAFIAASIIVPIIANGLRAFMIVMIGHFSSMKLAVGVDHIIYGWIFFGAVIAILFYIGSFWREDIEQESDENADSEQDTRPGRSALSYTGAIVLVLALVAIWPTIKNSLINNNPDNARQSVQMVVPEALAGWVSKDEKIWSFEPRFKGASGSLSRAYIKGDDRIALHYKYYLNQYQGKELINSTNVVIPLEHSEWNNIRGEIMIINTPSGEIRIIETLLKSHNKNLLVWHWYWIGGSVTGNRYYAKFLEIKSRIVDQSSGSAGVFIATDFDVKPGEARERLRSFVEDMWGDMDASLHGVK